MRNVSESKAKKKRKHLLRTGGKDVELRRTTVSFSTHERMTKTKSESTEKYLKKHKKHFQHDE